MHHRYTHRDFPLLLPAIISATCLAGCGGGGDSDTAAVAAGGVGSLTLAVADAPIDGAVSVVVEFTGVELKPQEGSAFSIDYAEPRQIDLLDLQGGVSALLLADEEVVAGDYNWVRLHVNAEAATIDSFIELEDGSQHSLRIPSGDQTGLKLVSGFTVPVGGEADLTIDFKLRQSVHNPQGQMPDYVLRPSLRLVDNTQVGAVSGTVASALVDDPACTGGNAVYVFEGADVVPDDVDGNDPEPATSAIVELDETTGEHTYTVAFLLPGDYTVAFTCQAAADQPETSEDLDFPSVANVNVAADTTTVQDL